jgi:hypothetical protein
MAAVAPFCRSRQSKRSMISSNAARIAVDAAAPGVHAKKSRRRTAAGLVFLSVSAAPGREDQNL